jgi:hypothetical protein
MSTRVNQASAIDSIDFAYTLSKGTEVTDFVFDRSQSPRLVFPAGLLHPLIE